MKNIFLILFVALLMAGCSSKVEGLKKSPCAYLEIKQFAGA